MEDNIKTKKDNIIENLIGVLLIIPIYMFIFVGLNLRGDNKILFPVLMYLPIIIGIVLAYKNYNNKISKSISGWILVFLFVAVYFYYQTYFVELPGWDNLGNYFLWFISSAILKIFSCIFYGKIVGWKKAVNFLVVYVLLVVSSFTFGFWA